MGVADESDKLLIQSGLAKKRLGQPLKRSEQAALQRAQDKHLAESLRAIAPKLFNELFGIQNNQRNLWEDQLKIPCGRGREAIDLYAVGGVLRTLCSRRVELSDATPNMAATKHTKVQREVEKMEQQIIRLRTDNETLIRDRLPKQVIVERMERMAMILRGVGERMAVKPRLTGEEAQQMLNYAIDQYHRELSSLKSE